MHFRTADKGLGGADPASGKKILPVTLLPGLLDTARDSLPGLFPVRFRHVCPNRLKFLADCLRGFLPPGEEDNQKNVTFLCRSLFDEAESHGRQSLDRRIGFR